MHQKWEVMLKWCMEIGIEIFDKWLIPLDHDVTYIRGGINKFLTSSRSKLEPDTSFWYLIHTTSLKSYNAKLHISLTCYWLFTDLNSTIGRKSEILRFDIIIDPAIWSFCMTFDRLCFQLCSWLHFVVEMCFHYN